ncbi:retrovirus-related pol polyprotein from transposon TNT 1-94 [Tanacetum coccineum]
MSTLVEFMILSGVTNRPPMLEKHLYDSWKSIIELYMQNREHGRMILESVEHGPLIWPTIEENGVTRTKKYEELSAFEKIQADCDLKATTIIILQGLPSDVYSLVNHHRVAKDLINDMNIYEMKLEQFQVNTKFLNSLPSEWSKFVTNAKLVRDFHTTNFDQIHAYLEQHDLHANKVRIMRKRNQDPLALGRQSSFAAGTSGTRANISGTGGNYLGQQRVVKCFNCQREVHMARQCPKPKRKRYAMWFRDKVILVEAQGNRKVLNEKELGFLADPSIAEGPVTQSVITHNAAYQANDLDAYDSDCDEISIAKAVLMANLYSYDSDVLSEDTNSSVQQDAMILSVFEQLSNQVTNCNKVNEDNLIANESLFAELERYKERDKDAKFADFKKEINSLKQTLSEQIKEKESLTKTFKVFKNESMEKEAKNIDNEIALEKKAKELDNIVHKMGQSAQTVHMLTKPQIRPMLYDGSVIAKETNVISIDDSEETLMLEEESRSNMFLKQSDPIVLEKKVNIKPINYAELNRLSKDFGKSVCHNSIKNDLRKLKGKDIVDNATQVSNATTIAPGMYKLDPVILAPKVKNNREAHEYYLKHTMEQAAILRELIQELLGYVRDTCPDIHKPSNIPKVTNRPLLSSTGVNPSTSASGSKPSGNTKNDRISRTPSSNEKNKVEVQSRKVKSSLNKRNSDSKNVCNEHVKHPVKGAKALCSVCNECLFDANHAMCLIDHVNSMNVRAKSASKKNKKRKEWKPTRKVFNSVGYKWKPTGRTFTLVGNACPLTRLTATNKVPLRVPIPLEVVSPKHVVTRVYTRRPKVPKSVQNSKPKVAKSMTANRMELSTSRGSDTSVAPSSSSLIDCRLSKLFCGNITISRVYYVEGLGHNLFSVGHLCDSNLEVTFRKCTCFVHNLKGVNLLSGSRGTNLYSLSIGDMMASSPICLLLKATKTKSWLWHRRLSYLNFGAINHLARYGLVRGLPRLKFDKDHLCSACAIGKSKKQSHKPKSEDTNQEKLYLLHMDLCRPVRVASVNGKKLNATVRNIHTDNGTEFVNQTLRDYYEQVGISHETSVARTPQQNGVVERRNRTLVEAARTMLIYAKAPLFLWDEAVATACYTQNRSIIRRRHGKTPYKLLHDRKPDLSYLYVFSALCYPNNDSENLGKLQAKADIGIFIGYAPKKKAYRIYNQRTQKIIETIHVDFDELTAMASE